MNLDPFGLLGDISGTWILLSIIPSTIGFVMFMYGRKRHEIPHTVAGILLMAYPLVATTVTTLLVGGGLIALGFWYAVQAGW